MTKFICDDKTLRIPFDLNKAKAGRPVFTLSGLPVRIISYNRLTNFSDGALPIVALVKVNDDLETVYYYTEKGEAYHSYNERTHNIYDLCLESNFKKVYVVVSKVTSKEDYYATMSNIFLNEEDIRAAFSHVASEDYSILEMLIAD